VSVKKVINIKIVYKLSTRLLITLGMTKCLLITFTLKACIYQIFFVSLMGHIY